MFQFQYSEMSENEKPRHCLTSSMSARLIIVLSVIIVVVCFGWLIHVEVVLREHKELIKMKQGKASSMASFSFKKPEAEGKTVERKLNPTKIIQITG